MEGGGDSPTRGRKQGILKNVKDLHQPGTNDVSTESQTPDKRNSSTNASSVSVLQPNISSLSPFAKEFVPRSSLPNSSISCADYQETVRKYNKEGVGFESDCYAVSVLREFIHQITLSPGEYESRVKTMTDKLKTSVSNEETMRAITNTIFDQAITEPNFTYSAAKLCNHLSQSLQFAFGNFRHFLIQRCLQEHQRHDELLVGSDGGMYLRGFAIFVGELFSQLEIGEGKEIFRILGKSLTELLNVLLNYPTENNLKCVCQVLKLTGARLEDHERQASEERAAPEMDKIIKKIKEITNTCYVKSNIKSLLLSVVDLRASDWGRAVSSPGVQKDFSKTENYLCGTVFYGPDGQPISSEEASFLQNTCNPYSYSSIMNGEVYRAEDPGENMDEEMQAAFEEFLQQTGQ